MEKEETRNPVVIDVVPEDIGIANVTGRLVIRWDDKVLDKPFDGLRIYFPGSEERPWEEDRKIEWLGVDDDGRLRIAIGDPEDD